VNAAFSKLRELWHPQALRGGRSVIQTRNCHWLSLSCACAIVGLGYTFIASAGRFTNWPTYELRIDQLAEAFRAGHLHLLEEPSPALLAAEHPFDPANRSLWYWDASLYNGHYYWYWGPVPALLLAAVKTLFRIATPLGDQYTTFALALLQFLAGALLLDRLARRLYDRIPSGLVALSVVAFGFANPAPFMLARQCIYEAAIIGGHAFVLLGISLAFEAVWWSGVPRRSLAFAVGAGVAWALALGCRVSLAPAIPPLAVVTALAMSWQNARRWRGAFKGLLALGTPLTLGAGGLLIYNKARFEQWFEFGQHYQLTWVDFHMSKAFVAANAYSYALRPARLACKFPFVSSSIGMSPEQVFPSWFRLRPKYFVYEQVVGVFVSTPWAWLVIPALVLLGYRLWRAMRPRAPLDAVSVCTIWALLVLLFASLFTLALPLYAPSATMRYLGDAVGALILLASLGGFATYVALRRVAVLRRLATTLLAAGAVASAAVGFALGFDGYYGHFSQHNPGLLQELESRYSVCGKT